MISKKYQIVIARYNENINWLLPYSNISIIYNKGDKNFSKTFDSIDLPNFGRESHTYLYHIINNYDNLADRTIFFQGQINDHRVLDINSYFSNNEDIIGKIEYLHIDELKKSINHIGKWKKEKINGLMRPCKYTPYDWITKVIGISLNPNETQIKVIWGANFSLSKKIILQKPKIFYENILRYIDYNKNPEEGHFLERTWYLIFANNYIEKPIINTYFLKSIDNLDIVKNKDLTNSAHIWVPNKINYDIGNYYKISNIPSSSQFITIASSNSHIFKLNIHNYDEFIITIKYEHTDAIYEILFSKKSIIINKQKINIPEILYDAILDFSLTDRFIIKNKNIEIVNIENVFINKSVQNIKIKNISDKDLFLTYDDDDEDKDKTKIFISNNTYDTKKDFYYNNFIESYIFNLTESYI